MNRLCRAEFPGEQILCFARKAVAVFLEARCDRVLCSYLQGRPIGAEELTKAHPIGERIFQTPGIVATADLDGIFVTTGKLPRRPAISPHIRAPSVDRGDGCKRGVQTGVCHRAPVRAHVHP